MRFELMTSPLPRECSTPEPRVPYVPYIINEMERATGVEPATSTLEGLHSTN